MGASEFGGLVGKMTKLARRLRQRMNKLQRMLGDAEKLSDDIAMDQVEFEEALSKLMLLFGGGLPLGPNQAPNGPTGPRQFPRAKDLDVQPDPEGAPGSAQVRIDGGPPVHLPSRLTQLLDLLAADTLFSTDELIGWKRLEDLAKSMSARIGKPVNDHYVSALIRRLRVKLIGTGQYDWTLVQTDRHWGARFALLRPGPPSASGPPVPPV